MNQKKVAEILIDVLTRAGVTHCYGIVGDTLNAVTDAIYHSEIEWIHVRHEEAGALAAGAEAFITDKLTACAGSCGPGSLHFINGIYEAQRNNAPVILIASQLASNRLGTDFPQEVDFLALYQSISVYCQQVNNPKDARRIFTQAVQAALNKQGVAVVILPADISSAQVNDDVDYQIWNPAPILIPNENELQQIVEYLNEGQKIAIYAGIGCKYAHDELIELAKLLKAPIAHTSRAKDRIEYDNPYNVGMNGMFGTKAGVNMIKECDILLLLGCGFAWSEFYPQEATIIQIDNDATKLGLRHPISLGVIGDIKATIKALMPKLTARDNTQFLDKYVALYRQMIKKLDKKAIMENPQSIHPQYLIELIDHYASNNAMFSADVGSAMVWACRHLHTNGRRRLLISLKHATMANAIPQALGLKKAFPNSQVIAIAGDGGITMLLGELLTAVQENLPIKIFILNNGSLNFVEQEQKSEGLVNRYTDLQNGDLAMLAQGAGFQANSIREAHLLEQAVQDCLNHNGPSLLNVYVNPNELIIPPQISIENVKNMAVYGARAILEGKGKDVIDMVKDNL
ncbi:MAG: ubiquinone-dependent pyruvate dehydrogenase [Candidatus Schmidhempelia sp.]|nr:ubiquinone-dependent pyruvate dehydrogenase [Candidatus Schmidhempelia sp.]